MRADSDVLIQPVGEVAVLLLLVFVLVPLLLLLLKEDEDSVEMLNACEPKSGDVAPCPGALSVSLYIENWNTLPCSEPSADCVMLKVVSPMVRSIVQV